MINWDVTARQETPLLVWAAVHRVGDQILPDTAIMQERSALAWRSVPRHCLALPRRCEQEVDQGPLGLLHLQGKTLVAFHRSQPGPFFLRDHLPDTRCDGVRVVLCPAGVDAERAAVRR